MRNEGMIKRAPRFDVEYRGTITDEDGREIAVHVTDINKSGCRIRSDEVLKIGKRYIVNLPKLGDCSAQIRWSFGEDAGAAFCEPLNLPD